MSKYEEIMEHVNIDEKMQDRILSHIDEHFEKKTSRSSRRRFYTICATAAAAVLIVCVVNMQGGSSTSSIVSSDALIAAQESALDEPLEKTVVHEEETLSATALYKAAENELAAASALGSPQSGDDTVAITDDTTDRTTNDTTGDTKGDTVGNTTDEAATPETIAIATYEPQDSNLILAGGYTRAASPVITDEIRALCEKAFAGMTGATYEPVALLATQVVAGTNYCILCESAVVYPGATKTYKFVYIYEDLEGNATCTEIIDTGVQV